MISRKILTSFALVAAIIWSMATIACGPPSKKTIQKLHRGAEIVVSEIELNRSLPDDLFAEKLITADQLITVRKYVDEALSGAEVVKQGLADALIAEKPSLKTLAPVVANIIMNLRGLTSLVSNERVQKFFAAVSFGLRVLGSYFALQIATARKIGMSDAEICRRVGLPYDKKDFDLLANSYDGSRFDEYAAAL